MSQEDRHARRRVLTGVGIALALTATAVTPTTAGVTQPSELPGCGWRPAERMGPAPTAVGGAMDRSDVTAAGRTRLRLGRGAWLRLLPDGRVVVGLRGRLGRARILIAGGEACRLPRSGPLPPSSRPDGPLPPTGRWAWPPASGAIDPVDRAATGAEVDGECPGPCDDADQEAAAAFLPAGAARPVPLFAGGPWASGTTLRYAWQPGAVPPDWAKRPLEAAAADATASGWARSPRFIFDRDATNTVRYTRAFPSFCRVGIGCALRDRSRGFWATWLRPHGTILPWGTLRWCQRRSSERCFDLRRVQLHELGHVAGLNHPETEGSSLPTGLSVMTAVTPVRSAAGGAKHRFGMCDRAALQRAYDVPSRRQRIAMCQRLATTIRLWSDRDVVDAGESVRLRAELAIADRAPYERLGGNRLDGRSVRLRFRRAGSDDAWMSAWMEPKSKAGRYELRIVPGGRWEYRAAFSAPDDEGLRASRSEDIVVRVRR